MARRVRQTTRRRSKDRDAPPLRGADADREESAAEDESPQPLFSVDSEEAVAVGVPGNDYGHANDAVQNGEFDPSKGNGLVKAELAVAEAVLIRPTDDADDDLIPADEFDEAGYLRLNPDVRRAIELGQIESGYSHYLWHGRVEGRPLPNTPREARNVMMASPRRADAESSTKAVRCSVDALIIAPAGGLMIVGWIEDASHPLTCIRITGPDWRATIDASRYLRVRRLDVERAIGGHRLHAYGFIGFLHFEQGADGSGPIGIELWQEGGYSTTLQCSPAVVEDVELRDTVLGHLAAASFFGDYSIESMRGLSRGIGAELIRFNKAITRRIVAAPYVERFGPNARAPRGTIIVCLYGKPEFFFLQHCLYSGLPGIEDYEFVYVSNSPEIAEPLLREARSANLIYGLRSSVMILPGNAGFGAANNAAARVANSDRLLVVNPDVFPRDRDWAKKHTDLLAAAAPEQTRLFGVPLYYDDGSLMHGGIYFEVDVGLSLAEGRPRSIRICRTQHYGKGAPMNTVEYTRPRPVPTVTGAFISVERSWFEQLGGFTEDFIFGHYEDADLCLKSIEKGTAPWLQDIRMWHLEGKGSTRQPPHEGGSMVNRWLFSSNWMSMIDDGLTGPAPEHRLMHPTFTEHTFDPANGERAMRKNSRQRRASQ